MNQLLRQRGNANALNRAAEQNENSLEKRRLLARAGTPEPDIPATSATDDLVAFVRSTWKAEKEAAAAQPAPLSRQQTSLARWFRRGGVGPVSSGHLTDP